MCEVLFFQFASFDIKVQTLLGRIHHSYFIVNEAEGLGFDKGVGTKNKSSGNWGSDSCHSDGGTTDEGIVGSAFP